MSEKWKQGDAARWLRKAGTELLGTIENEWATLKRNALAEATASREAEARERRELRGLLETIQRRLDENDDRHRSNEISIRSLRHAFDGWLATNGED